MRSAPNRRDLALEPALRALARVVSGRRRGQRGTARDRGEWTLLSRAFFPEPVVTCGRQGLAALLPRPSGEAGERRGVRQDRASARRTAVLLTPATAGANPADGVRLSRPRRRSRRLELVLPLVRHRVRRFRAVDTSLRLRMRHQWVNQRLDGSDCVRSFATLLHADAKEKRPR